MNRRHVAFLVALAALAAPSSAQAVDFIVTTTNDNEAAPQPGSLRRAINDANSTLAPDRIVFNIPGGGVHTITPEAQFNNLTTRIDVDATTQPGYAGTPLIQLNGENLVGDESGFLVQTSFATVRGFAINNYPGAAILLFGDASDNNVIAQNHIGVDPSGAADGGDNVAEGLRVLDGDANLIENNVVSGNGFDGILFEGSASANRVEGNKIGTNLAGTAAIPNDGDGVRVGSTLSNRVGDVGKGNVIAGNADNGVFIGLNAHGSRVSANRIGVGAGGESVPNGGSGVYIDNSDSSVIGGEEIGAGNLIAFNGINGVRGISQQNTVLGNAIHSNGQLGIDMAIPGSEPNDDGIDSGTVNHPSITSVESAAGGIRVRGTLQTDPSEAHRVEVFSNPECDPSGRGEGARFLGSVDVTTNADGTGSFDTVVPGGPLMRFDTAEVTVAEGASAVLNASAVGAAEPVYTATATDSSVYTSEFSPCATLTGAPSAQPRTVLSGSAVAEDLVPGLVFPPLTFDAPSRTTELATAQDTLFEGPETLAVELIDPVGGSIGTPASVLVTIIDDDPPPNVGPPPPPQGNAQPDSSIDRIPRRIRASRLKRFRGRASDDAGLARVELAVLRLGRGASASAVRKRCGRLRATGRLRRVRPRAGRCRPAFVLRATGTTRWTYRLKRRLPKGRYVVYARAVDAAGVAERSFTAADGNRRTFRVT